MIQEETLVIIKPDAVQSCQEILNIYTSAGLKIMGSYTLQPLPLSLAEELYAEHKGAKRYDRLIEFMTSGSSIIVRIQGTNAIRRVRELNGETYPQKVEKGTIRYMFGTSVPENAVHGSENSSDATRELAIFF